MALVAYENSDSSEFEDDNEEAVVVTLNKKVEGTLLPQFVCHISVKLFFLAYLRVYANSIKTRF